MRVGFIDAHKYCKSCNVKTMQDNNDGNISITNPNKTQEIKDNLLSAYNNWNATLGKSCVHFGCNLSAQTVDKESILNQLKDMKDAEGHRVYESFEIDNLRKIPDEKFKYVAELAKTTKPNGKGMFSGYDITDLLQLPDKQLERVLSIFEKTKRFDAPDLIHLSELPDYEYSNIWKFIDIKTDDNKPRFDAFDIVQLSKLNEYKSVNAKYIGYIKTPDGKPRFNGFEIVYLSKFPYYEVESYATTKNPDGKPKYNIFEIEKLLYGLPITPAKENSSDTVFGKIKPIENDTEYTWVLEKLKKEKSFNKKNWWKQDEFDTGIMPYAGNGDIHHIINKYLHTGELPQLSENYDIKTTETLENYIRCFDYACKKVDEKYGKYQGIVYRYGLFDKNQQQYASCSTNPYCVVKHASSLELYNVTRYPYHIILTDNGHKINDVQAKLGSNYAKTESEIILNPDTKYELLEELTPEQEKIKQEFIKNLKASPWGKNINDDRLRICFWKEIN